MKYADTDTIFVRIIRAGFIPQLGISGPIPNPIKITRAKAKSLIVAGVQVWEFNPTTKETKELTLQNVFGEPDSVKKEETPVKTVAPVQEPKPTQFVGVQKDEKKESAPVFQEAKTDKKEETPAKEEAKPVNTNQNNNKNKNKK